MPELPEVETVVRELAKVLTGKKIEAAKVFTQKIRIPVPSKLDLALKNKVISSVYRRAKYILIELDDEKILVIHLGMSGRIHIQESGAYQKKSHDHLWMKISNDRDVIFNDPRRFGLVALIEKTKLESHSLFSHLGPEPFDRKFSEKLLETAFLRKKKVSIKVALMDQELVVGVGNIYASEALFEAGIDPQTPAADVDNGRLKLLVRCVRDVLKKAIAAGGSTLKDYRKVNGDLGYFQHKFAVYDRAGKACRTCTCDVAKTGGVQKITQGGRSTFYCPRKQV